MRHWSHGRQKGVIQPVQVSRSHYGKRIYFGEVGRLWFDFLFGRELWKVGFIETLRVL